MQHHIVEPRTDRVSNEPLREAFRDAGVSPAAVCHVLGWIRQPRDRADTTKLMRLLGLAPLSDGYYRRTLTSETADLLRAAIATAVLFPGQRHARVENEPLREAFVASGLTAIEVCRRVTWWQADGKLATQRLRRVLGLVDRSNGSGESYRSSTLAVGDAERLCDAIGVVFDDLYPDAVGGPAGVCSTPGCGEPLYELRDGLCGWCVEDREGVAA